MGQQRLLAIHSPTQLDEIYGRHRTKKQSLLTVQQN